MYEVDGGASRLCLVHLSSFDVKTHLHFLKIDVFKIFGLGVSGKLRQRAKLELRSDDIVESPNYLLVGIDLVVKELVMTELLEFLQVFQNPTNNWV
ncbi:unnamed protein product [Prunus armeniaca]